MTQPALVATPMHGQHKLSNEGYRTRDGHMIEWFGRKLVDQGPVSVVSRPEPRILAPTRRYTASSVAANTVPVNTDVMRLPSPRSRQRWWVDSLPYYHRGLSELNCPLITWNPVLALSSAWQTVVSSGQPVALDLLDDWTVHYAFQVIDKEVDQAYRILFEHAELVTANAEGTAELARRYGREDVVLLPNGCDPERFNTESTATGPLTVGYLGKIGNRLDLDLVIRVANELPEVSFVFAGPILDAAYKKPLAEAVNITTLGDVHYEDVPALLQTFDIGWVPHAVEGGGVIGGDIIKTYEYRAAGLPVITSPVKDGANSRNLGGVRVAESPAEHVAAIRQLAGADGRAQREIVDLPDTVRWSGKAELILNRLGLA